MFICAYFRAILSQQKDDHEGPADEEDGEEESSGVVHENSPVFRITMHYGGVLLAVSFFLGSAREAIHYLKRRRGARVSSDGNEHSIP